ncbi:MAG TPA: Asp-tRNA(Asn)/Glu-tRNA(Gln) amidotransferase subunit GatA [Anaerolineaceae bacterium]|nr:Asp-tRNA(Asn)/Glu-tRNA(Gln) amidotransferase subunit GatA [Anaerolineaceae bacterium]HPN53486.1 Asp-tRNA(Asn)/Glu-tRNA(Gln) amidotransferase subunit GatA [Anaerolineaceae bacterium]
MTDLTDLTVLDALQALRSGQVSSRELTQACLDRISRLEPAIRAFITLTPELALQQADEADRKLAAARRGSANFAPLLGLPLAVKDVLTVKGVRCTCGSRILENFVPPFNATVIERLLAAGVVVLGKTNMDEFAMGSSTENSAYGPTRNPWNLEHVPGGSSGGSAAAVAAHMAPAALGSDTGGSVRQPASYCGISGLKPTYGRFSRYGLVAYGSSLDTVGIFARTVADVAALFPVMAGMDPLDATSMDLPVPDTTLSASADLKGMRIGLPAEYFIDGMQPAVENLVRQAIETLHSLGAEIIPISLPHTEYALPVYYLIAPAEASANLARYDGIRFGFSQQEDEMWAIFRESRGGGFGQEVKRRIMLGTYALSAGYYDAYYGRAQKVRTLIKRDFEKAFESVDAVAAPVAPSSAFRLGEHTDDPIAMYLEDVFTLPANLAGVPGLAFPVGFDGSSMPVGMQLMGRHYREDQLFKIAHAYQQVTDWHRRSPQLA